MGGARGRMSHLPACRANARHARHAMPCWVRLGWVGQQDHNNCPVAISPSNYPPCRRHLPCPPAVHGADAQALGKPLLLEEFGTQKGDRDAYFAAAFSAVEASLKAGGPLKGALFWQFYAPGQVRHGALHSNAGCTAVGSECNTGARCSGQWWAGGQRYAVLTSSAVRRRAGQGRAAQ